MDKYFTLEVIFLIVSLVSVTSAIVIARRVAEALVRAAFDNELKRLERKLDAHLLWHLNHQAPDE